MTVCLVFEKFFFFEKLVFEKLKAMGVPIKLLD